MWEWQRVTAVTWPALQRQQQSKNTDIYITLLSSGGDTPWISPDMQKQICLLATGRATITTPERTHCHTSCQCVLALLAALGVWSRFLRLVLAVQIKPSSRTCTQDLKVPLFTCRFKMSAWCLIKWNKIKTCIRVKTQPNKLHPELKDRTCGGTHLGKATKKKKSFSTEGSQENTGLHHS